MGSSPSHARAALRLLARGLRRREMPPPAGPTARRRLAADSGNIRIEPSRVRRYRKLVASVLGPSGGAEDAPVPATFSSTWESALALELFTERELPFPRRGLLHLESELISLRPLREGQVVRCRVELERMEAHPRGARLTLRCRTWTPAGQLCQENTLVLLVLDGTGGRVPKPSGDGGSDRGGDTVLAEWRLGGDLGRRYAAVSGDYNPIHLWRWSSRIMGFDRPILHGFCIQALLAEELSRRLWQADPTALRRLRVAFRAPLRLPGDVLLVTTDDGVGSARFRIVDAAEDTRTYAEGEYVGRELPR